MTYELWATASSEDRQGRLEEPYFSRSKQQAIDEAKNNGGSMFLELWTVSADDPVALACLVANVVSFCGGFGEQVVNIKRYKHRVGGPVW